jgi:2-isopropylmalate synthase
MKIATFDTTLRDGTQGEFVTFSVDEKLLIARRLDALGIDYIEGGWPESNPKDKEFFARAAVELKLEHAKLTAFGATRLAKNPVEQDRSVRALAEAGTPTVAIFGKSWDLHVKRALRISLEENLALISETVSFLRERGKEVIYDAEHFFDGYRGDPDYAMRTLEAAKKAGAAVLCLCDTNGGTLTSRISEVVGEVYKRFGGVVGIHTHNDGDMAVANAVAAVEAGASHVQGCLNGYGERCGNATLASVIANLELKAGYETIGAAKLTELASACRYIAELANLPLRNDQPFVGKSAFAHKGGVHVSAVLKDSSTYEHVRPEAVGNRQRVLISDLAGRSNIFYKLKEQGLADRLDEEARQRLLDRIKTMEFEGYELESADGTFELLVWEALRPDARFFEVESYDVSTRMVSGSDGGTRSVAAVTLRVRDKEHSAAEIGHGPFHALHQCVRKCLVKAYPKISSVHLTDYKVRVLDSRQGTAAKVLVRIEWSDGKRDWATVGVSDNVIDASWKALVDAIRLELMRLTETDTAMDQATDEQLAGGSSSGE